MYLYFYSLQFNLDGKQSEILYGTLERDEKITNSEAFNEVQNELSQELFFKLVENGFANKESQISIALLSFSYLGGE